MKLIASTALLASLFATHASAQGYHLESGYVNQNGTYVAPHYQTNPDNSLQNNWSTRGNVNPMTGQQGTVNPYAQQQQPMYRPAQPFGSNSIYNQQQGGGIYGR